MGRVKETIDPLGNRTTTLFDAYGRVEATVNPLGESVTTAYDSIGRVEATVDQLGGRTTFVYDALDRRVNIIDPVLNKTTFVYDALGRQIEQIDPLGQSATFAYDAAGQLTSATDRLGRRRDFGYDNLGRRTSETWIAADGSTVDNRLTFTYDAVGNLLTAQDADGAYTLTYDALNRPSTVIDVWGNTLTFTWDAAGNRTKVEDSKGGETNSTFDDLNRLTNRQLLVDEDVQLTVTQEYNAEGRVTNLRRYGHGAPAALIAGTSYTYDNVGRLENLHHQGGLLDNSINTTYAYDTHSRLTSEIRNGSGVSYTYDDTDQLTADGAVTVTYDANGNRNNSSYGVGAGNRITTDGTWTYTYDDEGNLAKKSQGANALTWTYGYDHRNQLTHAEKRATDGGTLQSSADYKYDVFGNRIEKSVDDDGAGANPATVTKFALDGWKNTNQHLVGNENWDVWADLDSNGSLTTRYARGDVIDELFARIESSGPNTYWYLTDRLGSIRDVVEADGDVVDSISYDGFGNILSESNDDYRGRYAWTGREVDVEIELQYNRARYYDAKTGRWISRDPLGFDAGDSNLYRYVRNEPTGYTDSSGLAGEINEAQIRAQYEMMLRRRRESKKRPNGPELSWDDFREQWVRNNVPKSKLSAGSMFSENGQGMAPKAPEAGMLPTKKKLDLRDLSMSFDENFDGRRQLPFAIDRRVPIEKTFTNFQYIPASRIEEMRKTGMVQVDKRHPEYAAMADISPDGKSVYFMIFERVSQALQRALTIGINKGEQELFADYYKLVKFQPPVQAVDPDGFLKTFRSSLYKLNVEGVVSQKNADRMQTFAGVVEFAAHMVPGFSTVDNVMKAVKDPTAANWAEAGISFVGDAAWFLGGPLASLAKCRGYCTTAMNLGRAGFALEAGVTATRFTQGVFALYNGQTNQAAGYFGEATMRLLGLSASGISRLRNACFAAGTRLRTPTGDKAIEDFRVGDTILSAPEDNPTAPPTTSRVVRTFRRLATILNLHVGGQVIRTTAEHPFYVIGKGWLPAHQLQPGDMLRSHDEQWIAVEAITETEALELVYNLQIEHYHTYFAGDVAWGFSVWSHNTNGCGEAAQRARSLREQYVGRTPSRNGRTGREVIERMEAEGSLRRTAEGAVEVRYVDPLSGTESWHSIRSTDMGHLTDAVTYWNETGRFLGPRHPEVRRWMLDSANYELQLSIINRANGARLGQRYQPPAGQE